MTTHTISPTDRHAEIAALHAQLTDQVEALRSSDGWRHYLTACAAYHHYSLGNILLANGGNLIHSIYVYSLPPGPIWLLHTFHLTTTGLMLAWYARYEWRPQPGARLRRTRLAFNARLRAAAGSLQRTLCPAHWGS